MRILLVSFTLLISQWALSQKQFKIVSSASIIMDMAEHIAGDKQKIDYIVPIGGDPHLHTPTPRDAQIVSDADLIMINGMTFEGWINELISNSGTSAKVVTITDGVNAIRSEKYKNSADPHAWMDVSNALIYIKNIWQSLVELDPENRDYYTTNYESYKKEIEELDNYITDEIRKIPLDKRVLITSHDAFAYYGKRYGIRVEALMGISTEAAAGTSDMSRVIKVIRENNVPAIFVESTINPKLINQIAKDNNVKIGGELYADSIGDKDSHAPGYTEMLRHNTDTIVKALLGAQETISVNHTHESENDTNLWLYLLAGLLLVGGLLLAIAKINNN